MSSKIRPSTQPAKPMNPNVFPTFAQVTGHIPQSPEMPSPKTAQVFNVKSTVSKSQQRMPSAW